MGLDSPELNTADTRIVSLRNSFHSDFSKTTIALYKRVLHMALANPPVRPLAFVL